MQRVCGSLLGLWAGVVPALAAAPPPPSPLPAVTWVARSKTEPATRLDMGAFEVRFEQTTLASVRGAAGRGLLAFRGDAGDSMAWLCYTLPQQRVWVMSGEMGGAAQTVTSVVLQTLRAAPASDACPMLPERMRPVTLSGTVRLGMSVASALQQLGQPSHKQGAWLSFDFQAKVRGNCAPDGFDRMNWLLLKVAHGRVVAIRAGQVTSC